MRGTEAVRMSRCSPYILCLLRRSRVLGLWGTCQAAGGMIGTGEDVFLGDPCCRLLFVAFHQCLSFAFASPGGGFLFPRQCWRPTCWKATAGGTRSFPSRRLRSSSPFSTFPSCSHPSRSGARRARTTFDTLLDACPSLNVPLFVFFSFFSRLFCLMPPLLGSLCAFILLNAGTPGVHHSAQPKRGASVAGGVASRRSRFLDANDAA